MAEPAQDLKYRDNIAVPSLPTRYDGRSVDLRLFPANPDLLSVADPLRCLSELSIPWREDDGRIIHASAIANTPYSVTTSAQAIRQAISAAHGPRLESGASTRTPQSYSCRNRAHPMVLWAAILGWVLVLGQLGASGVLGLAIGWVTISTAATTIFRITALRGLRTLKPAPPLRAPTELPKISLLIPLFEEEQVAGGLVKALERLTYPPEKLQVLFLTEASDTKTRDALAKANLPDWAEVLIIPPGKIRTKPKAMNYALPFCEGEIVGIYDAEDRPELDQLLRIVQKFSEGPPELACVQGVLDFRNTGRNWMTRCFTIEYAIWFRVFLRGARAAGLPIPLGGTTVFFKRDILEKIGGWDAHNVTEDADLGMRIARFGYVTEIIDSTTWEEATATPLPWIRQRSRWIKGFAITWATHMRHPVGLFRDLGLAGFLTFQLLFLGSWTGFLASPLFAAIIVAQLYGANVLATIPAPLALIFGLTMTASQFVMIWAAAVGLSHKKRRRLIFVFFTMPFYWPLASIAAYKALFEMIFMPYYWDKTDHRLVD